MRSFRIELMELLYYISVAFSVGLFLFLNVSLFIHRNLLTFISIFIIILMLPLLIANRRYISRSAFFFGAAYILCVLFSSIKAASSYSYSFIEYFYAIRQYIWVLLFFTLIYLFGNNEKKMKRVIDNTINILLVSLVIRFISWLSFSLLKFQLFPKILMEFGKLWYRNETSIRIDGTPLISIALFLSFYFFLKYGERKYFYKLLFMMIFVVFVNQTRMLIFPQLLSMFLMYLYYKKPYMHFYLFCIIAGIVCFLLTGGLDLIKGYINLFNNGSTDLGLGFRYWELKYYLSLLRDNHWIYGLGILTSLNANSFSILFGPGMVQMYLDDLGFVELFVQFGILSFFLYGYLIYKLVTLIRRTKNKKYICECSLFIGLLTNILVTAASLNIFGSQRIYSLVLIFALIFFYDYQLTKER